MPETLKLCGKQLDHWTCFLPRDHDGEENTPHIFRLPFWSKEGRVCGVCKEPGAHLRDRGDELPGLYSHYKCRWRILAAILPEQARLMLPATCCARASSVVGLHFGPTTLYGDLTSRDLRWMWMSSTGAEFPAYCPFCAEPFPR